MAGKHWTARDDEFLIAYYDAVGPMIGPRDLGRSEQATKNRVRALKKSGAWEAFKTASFHLQRGRVLAGTLDPEYADDDVLENISRTCGKDVNNL